MKKAFTLAEVLIVLAVLGIIAVLTVPSIIKTYNRTTTQTKIRKFYSTINNAIQMGEISSGESFITWKGSVGGGQARYINGIEILSKYLLPNLKISKDCRTNSCAYHIDSPKKNKEFDDFNPSVCLTDGTCFFLDYVNAGNGDSYGIMGKIVIYYDINGEKAPNTMGKDIFSMGIFDDRETGSFYIGTYGYNKNNSFTFFQQNPQGCISFNVANNPVGGASTSICSGWIYSNGFKIPKKYPWL